MRLTAFQQKIYDYLESWPGSSAVSVHQIAMECFAKKWGKPSGRGALIGHIDRAASKFCHRLAGNHGARFALREDLTPKRDKDE